MSLSLEQSTGNADARVEWREWGAEAFAAATAADRPILLHLTARWCQSCALMDGTVWSDPAIARLVNDSFIAIRVDSDRYPHVQDRYIAGGWPTTAFLTPTGEVLWAGTSVEADQFRGLVAGVTQAWGQRREELQAEIGRRRRALDATRRQHGGQGLVRREAADDVLTATTAAFDARNGGFGDAPKFPHPEAVELLYACAAADPAAARMADQTLDGMIAGELWDSVDGGFYRYATGADWTEPRREKLLDTNAALLDAYSLGAWLRDRPDWRQRAAEIVDWVGRTLRLEGGGVAASLAAADEYFAADAAGRAALDPPRPDPVLYTAPSARWIRALAAAGVRLDEETWITAAEAQLTALFRTMRSPAGGLFHFRDVDGQPHLDFLLADTLEAARAALQVAQATGRIEWLTQARELARHVERGFWSDDGGFRDRRPSSHDLGALRYPERPFEANALAARLLLDIAAITGERGCRALAERTLARLASVAGRHGPDGAIFALATAEYFDAAPAVIIALPAGAAPGDAASLRSAAWSLRLPGLRVWTVPSGHAAGPMKFDAIGAPAAWLWTRRACSRALATPEELVAAALAHA
jgi:uncharacterized protein